MAFKKYWSPIREIHQKFGVPIREIREKSESRPSAKLNPREIFEFRGRRHPRNLIPAKFNPIKVIKQPANCQQLMYATRLLPIFSSHQRNADLDNLFRHEISLPPPSYYTAGEVNICSTKSKLFDCLLGDYIILPFNINCPAILVDGSSVVQSHKPKGVRTFGECIEKPFIPLIHKYLSQYNRVDILFDRYMLDSTQVSFTV